MAKKPKKKKEDKILSELRGDMGVSNELYGSNFPSAPLPEYQDPFVTEQRNLLNLRHAFADPNNESFAGRYSLDDKAALDTIQQMADPRSRSYAGAMSPMEEESISRLRSAIDPNSMSYAGRRAPEIEEIIGRFRSGLEGYTAPENTAMREAASRGIDAEAATQRYNRLRDLARGRVRGGAVSASLAGIDRNRMNDQRVLEQDIFLKNADEKQNRLRTFADYMTGVDETSYNRLRDADAQYRDYGANRQDAARERGRVAALDFRDTSAALGDTYFKRGQAAIDSYGRDLAGSQNNAFTIGQFNIGQKEKSDARDVGTKMGLLGLIGERRNAERQNKIIKA